MGASPLAAKSVILRTGPARIVLSAVAAAACLSNMALPQDDFADLDIETLDREAEKETVGREDDRAPQLLIAQAETQARNGQFMDAITSYRTFLKRHLTHRKSAEATKRIAELEAKVALKKREAELRGAIEKLAADPARQTAAWLALGDFYVEHKQYADVVGLCREMVSAKVLTPQSLEAPTRVAALLEEANQPKAAIEAYEAAFVTYPDQRGNYYESLLLARTDAKAAGLRLDGTNPGIKYQRSLLEKITSFYERLGDRTGAAPARARLIASLPEPETEYCRYLVEAEREFSVGNYAGACALYLASLKFPPAGRGLHRGDKQPCLSAPLHQPCLSVPLHRGDKGSAGAMPPVPCLSAPCLPAPLHRGDKQPCLSAPREDLRAPKLAAIGAVECGNDAASRKDPISAPYTSSAGIQKPQPQWQLERIFRGLWTCGQALTTTRHDDRRLRAVLSDRYPALAKELEIAGADASPAHVAADGKPAPGTTNGSAGPLILARMWEIASKHAREAEWEQAERVYCDMKAAMIGSFFEPVSLYWLGRAASQRGLYAQAIGRFGQALERADVLRLQPCGLRHRCLYERGLAQLRWERYTQAEGTLGDFLATPTVSPLLLPLTLYRLGQCYESQGDPGKALETYRALLELECTGLKLEHTVRAAIGRLEGQ